MENINIDELHQVSEKIDHQEEVILDVRTPEEFSDGHIPKAHNINHAEVAEHTEQLKNYKKIYIVCQRGARAQMASADLESCGLTNIICVSDGGMGRWIESGWPVEQS